MISLDETHNILVQKNKMEQEYSDLIASEKPKAMNVLMIVRTFFIIGCLAIIGFWVYEIIKSFDINTSLFMKVGNTIMGVIFMLVSAIAYTIVVIIIGLLLKMINILIQFFIKKTDSYKQKIHIIQKNKEALEREYQRLDMILSESIVPYDYRELVAVEFIQESLGAGRVNDIQEAINLYVSECQHQELMNAIQESQRMNEQKHIAFQREISNLKREVARAKRKAHNAESRVSLAKINSLFK
ncbi:hypothetical protein [Priestia aryabhattai]|uniref:hypothetical protein n=1 Tax=Priestia aryabhattai TaxID=412384 RepID=UPI0015F6DBD5|nr:hypothetical protein [Priestia aryabhattai]